MASSRGKDIVHEDIKIDGDEEHNEDNDDTPYIGHRSNDDFELKVGMVVYSEDEAYKRYNNYAISKGFSVRRGKKRYIEHTRIVRQQMFLCSCEGFSDEEQFPYKEKKVERLLTRTGCKARVVFKVENGVYEIIQFTSEHNHPFVRPEQRHLLRSAPKIMDTSAVVINPMSKYGIRERKACSCLAKEADGTLNARFTEQDCHNVLQTQRSKSIEAGDVQSLLNYFRHKQVENPMFFYTMQVDDQNRIINFFWRDGLSRLDYDYFGDVVIFDTSYCTDKYNMICAPFVGVNHHRKNVLFGCAFLLDRTTTSFVWLFEAFLESMGNKAPKTIFTDQDHAMSNAIEKVFPNTRHSLCTWHIAKNVAQNLSKLFEEPGFKNMFTKLLYGCESEMEFESTWKKMIEEWGVGEDTWLKKLYDLRGKWCLAFSRDTFFADVGSTQRSESTNNIFQQMACKTMNLTEIVQHYEDSASRMRDTEVSDDFASINCEPQMQVHNSTLLRHAARVYTHTIFKLFQNEFLQVMSENILNENPNGPLSIYTLRAEDCCREHTVHFFSSDYTITCSCQMFESMGWLCRHALKVLNVNGIKQIPNQYILKRWTKVVKEGVVVDEYGELCRSNKQSSKTRRFNKLMSKASSVMSLSAEDDDTTEIANTILDRTIDEVRRHKAKNLVGVCYPNAVDGDSDVSYLVGEKTVLDPPKMKPKGVTCGKIKGCLEKRKERAPKEAITSLTPPPNTTISSQAMQSMSIGSHLPVSSQQIPTAFYPTYSFGSPMGANFHNQFIHFLGAQTTNVNPNGPLNNQGK
uniref:SWIM-type domain-containing protein n=1 Tax=Davidia involucrata TaxID=16924 RepID=A0A5B7C1F7_DAVIN